MYDLIGKRRYAYVASGIVTVVSLVFILLTLIPGGDMGLRFSIAYTGGTVWEVHFEGETPSPADVRAVLEEHGLPGSEVAITGADGRQYVLIRTEALTLIESEGPDAAPGPTGSPAAAGTPSASAGPTASASDRAVASSPSGASASPAASAARPSSDPARATVDALARLDAALSPRGATSEATVAPTSTVASSVASPAASPRPSPGATPFADPSASPGAAGGAAADDPVAGVPTEGRFGEVATALQERFGRIDEVRQQNSVGPVVSNELIQQTFLLILFASLAIMIWITYRFRDMRMGVTALVALLHDVIVTVGVFALLGTFIDLQIDALFVTAMLTVIGFSVHDTIVVFDRVRENRQRYVGEPIEEIVAFSLMQTIGRSITTSLTIVVTLLALFLLGSDAIRSFTLTLLIGVAIGAYSSIFVATPLFVDWYLRDERRKDQRPAQASAA